MRQVVRVAQRDLGVWPGRVHVEAVHKLFGPPVDVYAVEVPGMAPQGRRVGEGGGLSAKSAKTLGGRLGAAFA